MKNQIREIKQISNILDSKNVILVQDVISPVNREVCARLSFSNLEVADNDYQYEVMNKISIIALFHKFADVLEQRSLEIANIAVSETGSPIKYHLEDIKAVVNFARNIDKIKSVYSDKFDLMPKGRVLINMSSNEPIILSGMTLISSLYTGNQVFIRPSTKTPSIPFLFVNILLESGLKNSLVHFIPVNKNDFEMTLVNLNINYVLSFGSTMVNRQIAKVCVENGIDYSIENDGNDWVYVDNEIGVSLNQLASLLAKSIIKHNGQMCDTPRAIFLTNKNYLTFYELLKSELKSIKTRNPYEMDTDFGNLLIGTDGLLNSISDIEKNSEVVNNYLIIQSNNISDFVDIETPKFVPHIYLAKVSDINEMISFYRKHNKYGLGFTIFSSNKENVELITDQIKVGRININKDPVAISYDSPWGGVFLSGNGGSIDWIDRFVNRRYINE